MDVNEKECIAIIRSILLSTPNVLKATRLSSEFQELEGRPFPFRQLGFSSFLDYLRSIPTEVKLTPVDGYNPDVLPVQSNASKHIENLVLKQRSSQPRKRGVSRRRGGGCGGWSGGYRDSIPRPRRRPPAIVPPHKGVYVGDIEKELIETHSKERLTRNGIHTVKDLLTLGSDMVECRNNKVYPKMHASTDHPLGTYEPSHSIGRPPLSEEEDFYDDYYDNYYSESDHLKSEEGKRIADNIDLDCIDNMDEEELSNYTIEKLSKSVDTNTHPSRKEGNNEYMNGKSQGDEDHFSSQMIKNFRKILSKYPEGIWSRDLPEKYYEEVGAHLDIQGLNYASAVELASCLPSVFRYERSGLNDFKLFDAQTTEKKFESKSNGIATCHRMMPYIPEILKNNIKDLLNVFGQGVRSTDLQRLYEDHYKKRLDIEVLGFDGMGDFLENIKDVVIVIYVQNLNYYLILPKFNVVPFQAERLGNISALPEPIHFIGPADVMRPGDLIPDQVLPAINSHPKSGDPLLEIEIRVSEVITPHLFYIMLDANFVELENLMDDLDKFYQQEEHNYKIVPTSIKENLFCACIYNDCWHRVKVLQLNGNTAKILYIDYGTPETVKHSQLRYLHVDFSKMPAQAICSKLMGIQPCNNGDKWSMESKQFFLNIISDKRLFARVYAFLRPQNKGMLQLSMVLFDVLSPDEIVINEYLVQKGYAEYVIKVEDKAEDKVHIDSTKITPASMNTTLENVTTTSTVSLDLKTKAHCDDMLFDTEYYSQDDFPELHTNSTQQMQWQAPTQPETPIRRPPPGFEHYTNVPPPPMPSQTTFQQSNPYYSRTTPHNSLLHPTNQLSYYGMHPNKAHFSQQNIQYIVNPPVTYPVQVFCPLPPNYFPPQYSTYKSQSFKRPQQVVNHNIVNITPTYNPYFAPLNNQSNMYNNGMPNIPVRHGLPSTPYSVAAQEPSPVTSNQNHTYSPVKPAVQVIPVKSVESISSIPQPSDVGISQNECEQEDFTESSMVTDLFNSSIKTESLSSSSHSHTLGSMNKEEATIDYPLEPKLSNGSREDPLSCISDDYVTATDLSDDNCSSESKNVTVEKPDTESQQSSQKTPDSWEDLDTDDTPLRLSGNINIDFKQSLDYLIDENYKDDKNLSNNLLTEAFNNIKIKDQNSNSFLSDVDIFANWKEHFNPDVTSSSMSNGMQDEQQSTLEITINIKETLIHKIDYENEFFNIIYINNGTAELAVLAEEFYPLVTKKKWDNVKRMVERLYKPSIVSRDTQQKLFMKLDNAEFSNKKLKLKKPVEVSYISEIPMVLAILNIENKALVEELKMLEQRVKSSS